MKYLTHYEEVMENWQLGRTVEAYNQSAVQYISRRKGIVQMYIVYRVSYKGTDTDLMFDMDSAAFWKFFLSVTLESNIDFTGDVCRILPFYIRKKRQTLRLF